MNEENARMQVFLSWSGEYSRSHAEHFAKWLPCVLQNVDCYLSSHSIDAGERWSDSIGGALKETDFGILFVTKQNKSSEWLMYEAGALAKNVSKSRVIPILINLETVDIQRSPLIHFQAVKPDEAGISRILDSLHNCADNPELTKPNLRRCLEKWFPELEEEFSKIKKPSSTKKDAKTSDEAPVEESLNTVLSMMSGLRREVRELRNTSVHQNILSAEMRPEGMISGKYSDPAYWDLLLRRCDSLEDVVRHRDRFRRYRGALSYDLAKSIDMKFARKSRDIRRENGPE